MSEIDKPLRKSVRKRQFPNEEQLSEQFLIYKNRRSGYVSELTKLIESLKCDSPVEDMDTCPLVIKLVIEGF